MAESLPSRERELKLLTSSVVKDSLTVAPLAGARIETSSGTPRARAMPSLPSRERELKQNATD